MSNIVVVGTQWGDEGKGKYVDLIGDRVQMVVRFGGGHNAGHTVVVGKQKFVLHLLPSGVLREGVRCVIGNGCVVDPQAYLSEVSMLAELGIEVGENLYISDRAQLILEYHRTAERLEEEKLGNRRIGTTCRGIGPAYEDKVGRRGLRAGDLRRPGELEEKLKYLVRKKTTQLGLPEEYESLLEQIRSILATFSETALPHVTDTSLIIHQAIEAGDSVLFEGAQATLLDIDHGTYPYVTSSNPTAGGACTGSGVSPKAIDHILGITKAYITRVGEGPLPTEMEEAIQLDVRKHGAEFGASTGRPRRCGWYDSVVVRYANRVNGLDALAITKLDVLDHLDEIKICTHYSYRGEDIHEFPSEVSMLEDCVPQYKSVPGWKSSTAGTRKIGELPKAARAYLDTLEELSGVKIGLVSTGPERSSTITSVEENGPGLLDQWF